MTVEYILQGVFACLMGLVAWMLKKRFDAIDREISGLKVDSCECFRRVYLQAESLAKTGAEVASVKDNIMYIRSRVDEIADRIR